MSKTDLFSNPFYLSLVYRFNEVWRDKDEYMNKKQTHYEDMIYAEKYTEVEIELRKAVDEIMRQELDLLQVYFEGLN